MKKEPTEMNPLLAVTMNSWLVRVYAGKFDEPRKVTVKAVQHIRATEG